MIGAHIMGENNTKQELFDLYDQLLHEQVCFLKELYYNSFEHLDSKELKELYMTYYAKTKMNPAFVYFIYNKYTNLVKIGKSNDPFKRLNELNSMFRNHFGVADALDILRIIFIPSGKDYTVEKMYHEKYKEFRTFGEWFKITKDNVLEQLPEFLSYDTGGLLENEGFTSHIVFNDVDDYTFNIFALDTLDYYTMKISEQDKEKALFLKKMIADDINKKYNKNYYGFLGFDVRNLDLPFSSASNNDVWEMFKWLFINKDKYALSTHYRLNENDLPTKKIIAFNKNVKILDYYDLVEKMANKVCFKDFSIEQ